EALLRLVQDDNDPDRRSRYAASLLHLGDPEGAKLVLRMTPNRVYRTRFIHTYREWHGNCGRIARMLIDDEGPDFRSGMCLAVGLIDPTTLSTREQDVLARAFTDLVVTAKDANTHSSAQWALLRWKQELPPLEKSGPSINGKQWFVNS